MRNTAREASRPSGQQVTRVQDLPLEYRVPSPAPASAAVHTRKDFSSIQTKRISLPEWHSKKDQGKEKAPTPMAAAQTVCQSRVFAGGAVVGTSHQVSVCHCTLCKCVIGDFIASDYIAGWATLRCLGWWP